MNRYSRLLLVFFSLIAFLSLGINWYLYQKARFYYLELNRLQLDPFQTGIFAPPIKSTPATEGRVIAFLGDSRALEWKPPQGLNNAQFLNWGVYGQTSMQVLQRYEQMTDSAQPDVIVLEVGINDLKTIALFPQKKAEIIEQCQQNIEKLTALFLQNGVEVVILATIFPAGQVPLERRLFWSPEINKAITDVNAFIRSIEKQGVILFDAEAILGKEGYLNPDYSRDLLHLNAEGYHKLNEGLIPLLSLPK